MPGFDDEASLEQSSDEVEFRATGCGPVWPLLVGNVVRIPTLRYEKGLLIDVVPPLPLQPLDVFNGNLCPRYGFMVFAAGNCASQGRQDGRSQFDEPIQGFVSRLAGIAGQSLDQLTRLRGILTRK